VPHNTHGRKRGKILIIVDGKQTENSSQIKGGGNTACSEKGGGTQTSPIDGGRKGNFIPYRGGEKKSYSKRKILPFIPFKKK